MFAPQICRTRNGYKATVDSICWARRFHGRTGYIDLSGAHRVPWAWLPDGRSIDPWDNAFDLVGFKQNENDRYRQMVEADL